MITNATDTNLIQDCISCICVALCVCVHNAHLISHIYIIINPTDTNLISHIRTRRWTAWICCERVNSRSADCKEIKIQCKGTTRREVRVWEKKGRRERERERARKRESEEEKVRQKEFKMEEWRQREREKERERVIYRRHTFCLSLFRAVHCNREQATFFFNLKVFIKE